MVLNTLRPNLALPGMQVGSHHGVDSASGDYIGGGMPGKADKIRRAGWGNMCNQMEVWLVDDRGWLWWLCGTLNELLVAHLGSEGQAERNIKILPNAGEMGSAWIMQKRHWTTPRGVPSRQSWRNTGVQDGGVENPRRPKHLWWCVCCSRSFTVGSLLSYCFLIFCEDTVHTQIYNTCSPLKAHKCIT